MDSAGWDTEDHHNKDLYVDHRTWGWYSDMRDQLCNWKWDQLEELQNSLDRCLYPRALYSPCYTRRSNLQYLGCKNILINNWIYA